jgi:hypothetical protein
MSGTFSCFQISKGNITNHNIGLVSLTYCLDSPVPYPYRLQALHWLWTLITRHKEGHRFALSEDLVRRHAIELVTPKEKKKKPPPRPLLLL